MKYGRGIAKVIIVVGSVAVLAIAIIYSIHVRNVYMNAEGKEKVIRLARLLLKYSKKEEGIPFAFLKEISSTGLLSDRRGVRFELTINDGHGFKLLYIPKPSSVFPIVVKAEQRLEITWTEGAENLEIISSIRMP